MATGADNFSTGTRPKSGEKTPSRGTSPYPDMSRTRTPPLIREPRLKIPSQRDQEMLRDIAAMAGYDVLAFDAKDNEQTKQLKMLAAQAIADSARHLNEAREAKEFAENLQTTYARDTINSRTRPHTNHTCPSLNVTPVALADHTTGRIKMLTPQEEQLNIKFEQAKMLQKSTSIQSATVELLETLTEAIGVDKVNNRAKFLETLNLVKSQVSQDQELSKMRKDLMSDSKQLAENFKAKLDRPTSYALTESYYPKEWAKALEARNIAAVIQSFNPDKTPDEDFTDTWNYVLTYTAGMTLTQKSYIQILLLVCKGSAHKTVQQLYKSGTGLDSILETLTNLYCKKRTIMDYVNDISDFSRNPDENIECTMSRAGLMIEKIKPLYTGAEWNSNRERMLQSILNQVISVKTKEYIDSEIRKCMMVGARLDYHAMLTMVDTYETTHNERPKAKLSPLINACTGSLIANAEARPRSDSVSKRLENIEKIISINAADVKPSRALRSQSRDRAAPYNRPKSIDKGAAQKVESSDWDMSSVVDFDTQASQQSQNSSQSTQSNAQRSQNIQNVQQFDQNMMKYLLDELRKAQQPRDRSHSKSSDNQNGQGSRSGSQQNRGRSPYRKNYSQNSTPQSNNSEKSYNPKNKNGSQNNEPPYVYFDQKCKRFSFKTGDIDLYFCDSGCPNSLHVTKLCPIPRKNV